MNRGAGGRLESDTCRDLILPTLTAAGWTPDQIIEQRYFTDGRIVKTTNGHRRKEGLRADYLLETATGLPLAVLEAKREYKLPADGLQQAMRYAEVLGLGVAFASNGHGIVEHDFATGRQAELAAFPSPAHLWDRHRQWRGLSEPAAAAEAIAFNRELRTPDGSIKTPRYYQTIAINRLVAALANGDKRALVTMATGTGKTLRGDAGRLEAVSAAVARRPSPSRPVPRRP